MTAQITRHRFSSEENRSVPRSVSAPHRRLRELIEYAERNSPYYSARLKGLKGRPLSDLPTLSKAELMDHWDEIVCDPRLRWCDLEHYVRQTPGPELYLDQYRVLSTSGTSRREAILAFSRREWTGILAGLSRGMRWLRQVPDEGCYVMVGAGADNRISMSQELSRAIRAFRPKAYFVDCREPLSLVVDQINALQPTALSGYASILGMLADEQLSGRLRIALRTINTSAEICPPALKARLARAFDLVVDETYTVGEAGVIAATCHRHRGMHVMTDDVVLECVDSAGAPVLPGNVGDQLLLTVLRSRTLPLIRYAIPDRVRFASQPCDCGLPGPLIESVEGRTGEVLELPARDGDQPIRLSAWEFEGSIQRLGITLWQLVKQHDGLVLRVRRGHGWGELLAARDCAEALLRRAGSDARVRVMVDDALALGPAGKLDRLVVLP